MASARALRFEPLALYADTLPRYWCDDDAFKTRFLEAVSLLAPEVERFFIIAVLDSLADIPDAELSAQCMAFVHEEASHSRDHRLFNRRLATQGFDANAVLGPIRRLTELAKRRLPARWRLELSAAGEHLSALASQRYLQAGAQLPIGSATIDGLFRQHAREEIDHCAQVFDVLRTTGGARWMARTLALIAVSLAAGWCLLRVLDALLRLDAPRGRLRLWRHGISWLLRPRGWLAPARSLRDWLLYLRPGFHPLLLRQRGAQ